MSDGRIVAQPRATSIDGRSTSTACRNKRLATSLLSFGAWPAIAQQSWPVLALLADSACASAALPSAGRAACAGVHFQRLATKHSGHGMGGMFAFERRVGVRCRCAWCVCSSFILRCTHASVSSGRPRSVDAPVLLCPLSLRGPAPRPRTPSTSSTMTTTLPGTGTVSCRAVDRCIASTLRA